MTTQTQNAPQESETTKGNRPTHVAKVRHGHGKKATYEQIGVAWKTETGALYIKLAGTQLVSQFALYELPAEAEATAEA